ncbi:MAG: ATP-binding cassette domain-containing protein [Candidatus Marinimicrobia bacterium]|nr:ATP-binding cassette domain-containing protein [Candidatus Neomarinimicrobiota bacterium]
MVRIENLVKNYGEVKAVRSINFTANKGEILGFLGSNGAGKSTTLKMVSGYLAPTAGNVYINDLNILDNSLEIRQQIGYLPELNPLWGEMVVYDVLQFTARIYDIVGRKFEKALDRVIDQCGLNGILHKKISACSKGYKQRVGLAMAIIHDPKILILDEPVNGLDPNQIVEIRELIRNLGRDKTIIISSHILQEIQATADRIVVINQGQIVADGTNEELMASIKGNTLLTLETKNSTMESIESLSTQLSNISIKDVSDNGDNHIIQIEYAAELDPREDIFKYAIQSKWSILEMSVYKTNLEDVFRSLTGKEAVGA